MLSGAQVIFGVVLCRGRSQTRQSLWVPVTAHATVKMATIHRVPPNSTTPHQKASSTHHLLLFSPTFYSPHFVSLTPVCPLYPLWLVSNLSPPYLIAFHAGLLSCTAPLQPTPSYHKLGATGPSQHGLFCDSKWQPLVLRCLYPEGWHHLFIPRGRGGR